MKLYAAALATLLTCLFPCFGAGPDVDKGKALGNPSAPIRLELYSDFMCPHCKTFHETMLSALIKDYVVTGKAYLVNREYPLNIPQHVYSRQAAEYATAAARVGKYQAVSDALFRSQTSWGMTGKVWETVAGALSPDEQKKVQALVTDPAVKAEVQHDVDAAQTARLSQTPVLVITHRLKQQPWTFFDDYSLLRGYLDDLLKK